MIPTNIKTSQQAALTSSIGISSNYITFGYQPVLEWINPADGWVYWILQDSPSQIQGMLHYDSDNQINQNFVQTITRATLETESAFTDNNTSFILLPFAGFPGGFFKNYTSFAPQGANKYHYQGYLLTPNLQQFILPQIPTTQSVLPSDSTPFWITTPWGFPFYSAQQIMLNETGLYGVVDIQQTIALGNPRLVANTASPSGNSYVCLFRDDIVLTLVNATSEQAYNFTQSLINNSLTNQTIGFMIRNPWGFTNMRTVQKESGLRYNEKSMLLNVSYNNGAMQALAQNYIIKSKTTFTFGSSGKI